VYCLRSPLRYLPKVYVIGCGGTGGFVAAGLCRLLDPTASLVLVDPDRVEPRNLLRQNFYAADLGEFKSKALAERLARDFDRAVGYATVPISLVGSGGASLFIGCVDNGPARAQIAAKVANGHADWWLDAGNGENYGQVIIGNQGKPPYMLYKGDWNDLPSPTVQRPDLLAQKGPAFVPSCAGAVAAGDQGPVINQAMAAIVLEMTRRLFAGRLNWLQVFLDLEAGAMTTVAATPENVAKICGLRIDQITERR